MNNGVNFNSIGVNRKVFDNGDGTYTLQTRDSWYGAPVETTVISKEELTQRLSSLGNKNDSFEKSNPAD